MAGKQNHFGIGQSLVLGPSSTGSFTPFAITDTPYVAIQLVKASANNSVNGIRLHTSNVHMDHQENGIRWPSGSLNEYLWALDDNFTVANSGSLTAAPFTTGSAVGSKVYHVSGLNSRWGRLTIESNSGGTFRIITFGKE